MVELISSLETAEAGSRELSDMVPERFSAQTKHAPSGCIEWTGRTVVSGKKRRTPNERGQFSWNGKEWLCHRLIWTWLHGPIPAGLFVCHHCDNPLCVNPDHLMLGTHKLNMRDMKMKNRHGAARYPEEYKERGRMMGLKTTWTKGEGNPKAKLTQEQAMAIRADKRPTRFLVEEYGVSRGQIQKIRRGDHWALIRAEEG